MTVIHTIDLHYLDIPQAIAAYVVIGPPPGNEPVLIETGPASTLDHLRDGLAAIGLKLSDIRHALVTHIHLDHAGAAGHLARNGTRIYVHEFGAKHLIDPSRLIASATRIYGDQMERLWGTLQPVPEHLITPVHDGDIIEIGGLQFEAIDTPGHARHHHAFAMKGHGDWGLRTEYSKVFDAHSSVPSPQSSVPSSQSICFVGDIAGISVPGVPEPPKGSFISLPTPPPEFDPIAWHTSIDRLLARNFDTIYLTHFGPRKNPAVHFHRLHTIVDEHTELIRREVAAGRPRHDTLRRYIAWNRQEAQKDAISDEDFARYVSINLLTMNVDGILRFLGKGG